ncbi:MAG: glycosyl transferase family 1 [Thermodesulfatator sp.]|nr:MAG: glycosyl transferase family 1 [Thermodesulfatator sp.]
MTRLLDAYRPVAGEDVINHLLQLSGPLKGVNVVHVNSTRQGGGVAEILHKLVPLMKDLGINAYWEIIHGEEDFYRCTKGFHNALQGHSVSIGAGLLDIYETTNRENAQRLGQLLSEADFVFIHDPQPAALIDFVPERKGKWIWRCHIDCSRPHRPVWKYLRNYCSRYDASIFSLPEFAQKLEHPQFIIAPSIDPLSDKNIELPTEEVEAVFQEFGLDPDLPLLVQVSRFDRFKDPLGVIEAFRQVRRHVPCQLVLAGGGASDDPEGQAVLEEVMVAASGEDDIHILVLPPDAHRKINALQRAADIVIQKSIREGFGLTVSEGMWKGKPVIGGDTGGIRIQVIDHYTGFRVRTPEGAALRIRYLLHHREKRQEMGERARRLVRENFLLTRHLREYMALMLSLTNGSEDRIDISTS